MKEKVVVVTGSTSGIGHGIAVKFAQSGAKIVLNGFADDGQQESLIKEMKDHGASAVHFEGADLTSPTEIKTMFDNIHAKFGQIDILVNNAGMQHVSPIDEFPEDLWEKIIRLNLVSSFYTMKYSIPAMKKQNWGRIINIASAHALVASPYKSAYVAAKHGILGMTKSVAIEVAEDGITVNAICPGYVKTPLVMGQIADTAKARNMAEKDVIRNVILAMHSNKQFVEIEEVAANVMFLASEDAKSITGTHISIDGGWTAH